MSGTWPGSFQSTEVFWFLCDNRRI